jgi:two-component system alkaline phosphatase synthesis response regulator PhoP
MTPKVLIVDDEAYIRLLISQALEDLEDEGVDLLTAEDGEQALRIIDVEKPDLVFLDLMMPKMNGFDVCHAIKHELGLKNICVVMLTAKGQEFDKQRGLNVGADIYMTKPFDPDELFEKAVEILDLKH